MHPTAHYELMQARVADLHRQAERRSLALAAREARRAQRQSRCITPQRSGPAPVSPAAPLAAEPGRRELT